MIYLKSWSKLLRILILFLILLTQEYIHPYSKIYFPTYLILKWKTHTLLMKSIPKLPQKKKNSATCFVVSNQCNRISHLSFNLLFMVAEHSETYYPEFPLVGVQ